MDQRLKEVASVGDIDSFYTLLREDAHLLERIERSPFVDTPLHIAASEGHVDFAMEMMNLMPTFAKKLNQDGFSPMHIALQHGQNLVAFELLKTDAELVRVKGRKGITPLHYVVSEGNINLLAEFLLACPESIKDVTVRGETALHIGVISNRFEALKVLIGWLGRTDHKGAKSLEIQVLNRRDIEANTVLHLAAYSNQPQVVRLLLGCWALRRNTQNHSGLTALDILQLQEHENRDVSDVLRRAGGRIGSSLPKILSLPELLRSEITRYQFFSTYINRKRNNIIPESRNAMLVVAVLIITATYQTSLSPTGGVWQGENDSSTTTANVTSYHENNLDHPQGTTIMTVNYFSWIWYSNTLAFWLTIILTVILLPFGGYAQLLHCTLGLLCASYTISMMVISPQGILTFVVGNLLMLGLLVMIVVPFFFGKWRKASCTRYMNPEVN